LSHDHTGAFKTALAGVNTPETQQADNDLAVGRLVESVAHSPYPADTLLIATEEACQDAPDHVDSHRAPAYVIGPYVGQGAIVSTPHNQVSVLRTIDDILGTPHMNLNTAYQRPMTDVFDIRATGGWTYRAAAPTVLATTTLSLSQAGHSPDFAPGPGSSPDTAPPTGTASRRASIILRPIRCRRRSSTGCCGKA